MKNNRSKIINVFLIFITFSLIILIFYISSLLLTDNKKSSIVPKKIKASNITYSKIINLNETPTITITQIFSPPSPTPTEIVLAYNDNQSEEAPTKKNLTPTEIITQKITEIPQSGNIYHTLIIFASASLFVFFAFLF